MSKSELFNEVTTVLDNMEEAFSRHLLPKLKVLVSNLEQSVDPKSNAVIEFVHDRNKHNSTNLYISTGRPNSIQFVFHLGSVYTDIRAAIDIVKFYGLSLFVNFPKGYDLPFYLDVYGTFDRSIHRSPRVTWDTLPYFKSYASGIIEFFEYDSDDFVDLLEYVALDMFSKANALL